MYPQLVELHPKVAEVAKSVREEGDAWKREWASDLIEAGMRDLERCPAILPSAQMEGGFHIRSRPADVAFFNCTYRSDPFGFYCTPITNGEVGRDNWLYGQRYKEEQCDTLWDRQEQKLVPRTRDTGGGSSWGAFLVDARHDVSTRYICAMKDSEISQASGGIAEAINCLQGYEDSIRFSADTLDKLQPRAQWDAREVLRQEAEDYPGPAEDIEDLKTVVDWLDKNINDPEVVTRMFKKRYGGVPWI